jgi:hypothetical protein
VRVLAVDWSGKDRREAEFIWLADVRDGELIDLYNGLTREQLVARLVEIARAEPEMVVGLDFAFSFPAWWCRAQGFRDARDVWTAMRDRGEQLLAACDDPFWGRPGRPSPPLAGPAHRRTDADGSAKSVFQIGGAGAVGTGSIRGMPHLLTLADAGFDVWPFTPAGWPGVVEIYPRALTGPVRKSSWRARHAYLRERYATHQPPHLLERAAGSEDAFDAAVSALVMAAHRDELASLAPASDPDVAIEGMIWRPAVLDAPLDR